MTMKLNTEEQLIIITVAYKLSKIWNCIGALVLGQFTNCDGQTNTKISLSN